MSVVGRSAMVLCAEGTFFQRREQFLLGSEKDVQRSCGLLEDIREAVWLEHWRRQEALLVAE